VSSIRGVSSYHLGQLPLKSLVPSGQEKAWWVLGRMESLSLDLVDCVSFFFTVVLPQRS
jgi:hypothetical protein